MFSIIYGRQERKRFFGKVFVAFCNNERKAEPPLFRRCVEANALV